MFRDAPTEAIALSFGVLGDITDIITHAKFYVNWFRGFGVVTPQILPLSIGLAGRHYNSISTTVLHCDAENVVAAYYSLHHQALHLSLVCFAVPVWLKKECLMSECH